jgi:oxalate---CoA ligase
MNAMRKADDDPDRPQPAGLVHPDNQQVDSLINDVPSLLQLDQCAYWQRQGARVDKATTFDVTNLKTWFPDCDSHAAVWTPARDPNLPNLYNRITYKELRQELDHCPPFFGSPGIHVAIVLPADEMAGMALALLATMSRGAIAVPLDPRMPAQRLVEAMEQLHCHVLVTTHYLAQELLHLQCCADDGDHSCIASTKKITTPDDDGNSLGFLHSHVREIRIVHPGLCGRLTWELFEKKDPPSMDVSWTKVSPSDMPQPQDRCPTQADDVCLLLRTSGTTSKPKVVPITLSHLFYAGLSIATTLQLTDQDCNCNAMPLFHVGGITCNLIAVLVSGGSVLLAGPLKDPNAFLDHLTTKPDTVNNCIHPHPTWYYASPAMHKAIALTTHARQLSLTKDHRLRFIRSASAHLNHDLALQLSQLFQCGVIPTYGMSEAMPICSSTPIDVRNAVASLVVDSVGYPVGTSVCIVDPDNTSQVLPHGAGVGEICVRGAGVISHYVGMDPAKTHTSDGWLPTGDYGILDRQGRLFIKGRSKEMIKRGGEQIWPNQIDDVIEKVEGVATCVSFGVPNELLGEEVATAVVLKDPGQLHDVDYLQTLEKEIRQVCKEHLNPDAMPQQIKFVPTADALLRGATGKYLRSKMADHLKLSAVETGALRVLESLAAIGADAVPFVCRSRANEKCVDFVAHSPPDEEKTAETVDPQHGRIVTHEALNGLRFLVACFVVQGHVGKFPNLPWVKFQGYSPNMMIFFALGVIQTTLSVARPVTGQYAQFVGAKIGSLHALFVISQIVSLPSYILFRCLDENGSHACDAMDYGVILGLWILGTATGLCHGLDGNLFAWFQSVFDMFLMMFPLVDGILRRLPLTPTIAVVMAAGSIIAACFFPVVTRIFPPDFVVHYSYLLMYSMLSWFPFLIAALCSAYFFRSYAKKYATLQSQTLNSAKHISASETTSRTEEDSVEHALPQTTQPQGDSTLNDRHQDTIHVDQIQDHTQFWGRVCDLCSCLLLAGWITVALVPNCTCVSRSAFEAMRPGEPLPESCWDTSELDDYVMACDVTVDEFYSYVQPADDDYASDRYETTFSSIMGYWRVSNMLFLLWIFSLGFGASNSVTVSILGSQVMTRLAPLAYPIYLLHMAVSRSYWLITRGPEAQEWWSWAGLHPFPVEWYECFIILGITMLLGFVANTYLVPMLIPHTISVGVRVSTLICNCLYRRCGRCCCGFLRPDGETIREELPSSAERGMDSSSCTDQDENSAYDQLTAMVRGLTGVQVNRSMQLRNLGLDSLGATALLGMLRASVPAAKALTLQQLQQCETLGALADFLDLDSTRDTHHL